MGNAIAGTPILEDSFSISEPTEEGEKEDVSDEGNKVEMIKDWPRIDECLEDYRKPMDHSKYPTA